ASLRKRKCASVRLNARRVRREARVELPDLIPALSQVPPPVENASQRAADGRLRLQVDASNLESLRQELRESARRCDTTIIGSFASLGGILWLALSPPLLWPGIVLLLAGVATLVFARR